MKVSLQVKDDGVNPGTLHGEAIVEFDIHMKSAFEVLQKLQKANIPGVIAKALSDEVAAESDE